MNLNITQDEIMNLSYNEAETLMKLAIGRVFRMLDRENKTEFYTFYQDLKFYWAKTVLREHIVKELNCLFKKLDIKSEINITGIPTSKEILNFKNEFRRGEKNYDDFLKFLLY